jgi:hypothetical protein
MLAMDNNENSKDSHGRQREQYGKSWTTAILVRPVMDDGYNCKLIIGNSDTVTANYGQQLRIVRLISEKLMIRLVMEYSDGMATVERNS